MRFDPSQYETVKARKARFYADHKDGRITVSLWNNDLDDKAIVVASVYLNKDDQKDDLARGRGYAHSRLRDKELSVSTGRGEKYESVNFHKLA